MAEELDEKTIRQYLLGELAEAEMSQFEARLMIDDALFEMLLVVEDELIDERASNELPAAEQARFDAYFLSTPHRRERLEMARVLHEYANQPTNAASSENVSKVAADTPPSPAPVIPLRRWWSAYPYLSLAAAAVILIAIGLGVWQIFPPSSDVSKGLQALNKAYRQQRPIEARISELNYAPPPPITRGSEQEKFDYVARDRAERLLLDAVAAHPDAVSYHALGRLYLAEHQLDKAIEQFEKALNLDDKNAQLHSDYGVTLMEKGKVDRAKDESGKSFEEFAKSLEQFNKALELDRSLPEALFNRALCDELMALPQKAQEDWHRYLDKDPKSPWAEEAKRKLRSLEEQKTGSAEDKQHLLDNFISAYQAGNDAKAWQILRQGRARTGNVITERLLDAYLEESARRQDQEANGQLQMLSYAGKLEAEKAGDGFTKDLTWFYQTTSPEQRQALAEARRLMKTASEEYNRDEYEQTAAIYAQAKRLFKATGDSCEAEMAECWTGIANLRIDAKKSLRILEPLSETFKEKAYKYLQAQSLNARADAENSQRAFSKTLDLGKQAFAISEQIDDPNGMLRNLQFPVAMSQQFGDYSESLRHLARAFDLASRFSPAPHEIWPFYSQTAFNLYSLQLFTAALDFQQEALRLAMASGLPLLRSRSYARLGLIYEKLGDEDHAIENGELALAEAQIIKSRKSRENIIANSALNLAHLYRQRNDLNRALAYYDQAIQLHDGLNIQMYLFEAHKGKLLALIGLNDERAAEAEMRTAVNILEQYRYGISEESNRNAFFDLAQSLYDIAIDFSYSRMHTDDQALDYAESSHARSLLDLMKTDAKVIPVGNGADMKFTGVTSPATAAKIQGQLPEQSQIIEFAVLDDKILIWVISNSEIKSTESAVAASVLNERVRRYLDLIATPDQSVYPEAENIARELYACLISPLEASLNPKSYLCIVPDKILGYLPFGALISPATNHYFVDDHCFVLAPSASIFLAASENASKKLNTASERLFAVANPSFDHSRFADLPGSAKEVRIIAPLYAASLPLYADSASEARVKREMQRADVIHLASHYVVDEQSPLRSRLLLARKPESDGQPEADGFLQASEIYDMRLPRARLVVMSACQTGVERAYRGEGAISIARPFLRAGVPLVVASLWPVETDSTSDLMIRFHRHRKQDKDISTAEALRRAQQDMLHSADERNHHPYYWASFATIGGYAQF